MSKKRQETKEPPKEVVNTLSLKQLMAMRPEELAEQQHILLRNAVYSRLMHVAHLVKNEHYDAVDELLGFSGSDATVIGNYFIPFDDILPGEADIGAVISRLKELSILATRDGRGDCAPGAPPSR